MGCTLGKLDGENAASTAGKLRRKYNNIHLKRNVHEDKFKISQTFRFVRSVDCTKSMHTDALADRKKYLNKCIPNSEKAICT